MNNQVTDKKRHILLTAMKLFSAKGYRQTSMQEIADLCEMSKGSLYLHFKSKEELLLHIFEYYFQIVVDQCVLVERSHNLSVKEKLTKFVEIYLSHSFEYQEFGNMMVHEIDRLENDSVKEYIRKKSKETVRWMEEYLIRVYGTELKPYRTDCILILNGILMIYVKVMSTEKLPWETEKLAHFITRLLDYSAEGMMKDQGTPMIADGLWTSDQPDHDPGKQHPLVLIKQIKDSLATLSGMKDVSVALQSIAILKQELMELQPRKAILSGMIRNLEGFEEIDRMRQELCDALQINQKQ